MDKSLPFGTIGMQKYELIIDVSIENPTYSLRAFGLSKALSGQLAAFWCYQHAYY